MADQEDVELTCLHRHIKKTPTCRIVLTRNWQEVTCTKKGIRKSHTELGRKEREVMRSGSVPLGGDTEEKGYYIGGDPLWGISIPSHLLGSPVLGSNTGKIVPTAGCRAGGTSRRAAGSSSSTCEDCTPVCLLLKQGQKQGCQCWEQGDYALKGNGVSSDPTIRTSAPATWDPAQPVIAWYQPLSRWGARAHSWLWSQFRRLQSYLLPR